MKPVWPYILPLPLERKERDHVFQTVFGSETALEIMRRISPDKRVYQKDLISELDFSNKTIIEALKKLVSADILEQGMERRKEQGKAVWAKWYTPTYQGKWLALLLRPPADVPRDEAREIVLELSTMYMESIVKLCEDYGIEPSIFESIASKALLKMLGEAKQKPSHPSRVTVYGSAAIDTIAVTDKLPQKDEAVYISEVNDYLGGSAANVAVALSRLGVQVSFVGKVGGDAEGVLMMKEFLRNGVDVSGVIAEAKKRTSKTFIVVDRHGDKKIHVLGYGNSALALISPNEIDWSRIEESEIVYVGEVYTEVAELVTSYARGCGKKIVYRPGLTIIEFDAEKVRSILRNVDLLILNRRGWEALRSIRSTPTDLTKLGPEAIIVTQGEEGCTAYTRNESFTVPAHRVKTLDTTGAGDAFAAGLMSALLENKVLRDCINYALAVSAIKVEARGARNGLPTKSEVEDFMKRKANAQK